MSIRSDAVTIQTLHQKKANHEPLVMLTAYDATFAALFDAAGVDMLLVGDSLGMVIQGHSNTLPVTLDQMVYHTQAVSRGAKRAHIVGDLPFLSYQVSPKQAVRSAGRLVQEGGAHSVKLEGGAQVARQARAIVHAGIPVMGHLGLTPQSVHQMGGFKVQGRTSSAAQRILDDARLLEDAGCFALVLEGIPTELARTITQALAIPTIGIGAGEGCDGQVLVCYDLLGLNPHFKPKFVRQYATLHETITNAVGTFMDDVRARRFPSAEESFHGSPWRPVAVADEAPASSDKIALYSSAGP